MADGAPDFKPPGIEKTACSTGSPPFCQMVDGECQICGRLLENFARGDEVGPSGGGD